MDENPNITPNPNAPHPIDLGALNATNAPVAPMAPPVTPVDPMAAPPVSTPSGMPDLGAPTPGGSKMKMYIIIAVAVVALGGVAFAAYSFFFTDAENATELEDSTSPNSLTNSLSDNPPSESTDMEEMADIVDELKDVYPNESPPSLTLDASDTAVVEETTDIEDASSVDASTESPTESETPKKIAR